LVSLRDEIPELYLLFNKYTFLHSTLSEYAKRQHFTGSVENTAIVIHELIHIDSARKQGFYIAGQYYEPHLSRQAWPTPSNAEIQMQMTEQEKSTNIYRAYVMNTPNNHLGNVIDEINAYSQTLPFICEHEPSSAPRHLDSLQGHLSLANAWLRILENYYPADYFRLANHPDSRGALETIVSNGLKAVSKCTSLHVTSTTQANLYYIQRFANQPKPVPKNSH
jgi:hypothetical protein